MTATFVAFDFRVLTRQDVGSSRVYDMMSSSTNSLQFIEAF